MVNISIFFCFYVRDSDKPTPAPRGRSSFGGQSGGVIHVRHSPSSSNQSTPFGSAHRPNHSNHSPLVRSREHTPNHSRQSSGNLLPRTPNSRNHDGLSVPNRVQNILLQVAQARFLIGHCQKNLFTDRLGV